MRTNRVAVSAVSSWGWTFDEDLRFWDRARIDHVGLSLRKCDRVGLGRAVERVRAAGLRVANFVECGADPARWRAAAEALGALGGGALVLTTGPGRPLDWDGSIAALGERLARVLDPAVPGVTVAIENTGPLRVDLSFVTTLRDTVDAADALGCGVCAELNSCWAERSLDATLARARARLAHVQISDWKVGSLCTPDRCVPGDGDIPLARLVRAVEATGYRGAYEIEMIGPRIENEGYAPAITRAVEYVEALVGSSVDPSP